MNQHNAEKKTLDWILFLLLNYCMTMSKLFNFSENQFLNGKIEEGKPWYM